MAIKNIGIIGVGGVGGFFGGKLCRLLQLGRGFHLSFIARGEHLRTIQSSGLVLSSEAEGEVVCVPSLATADFGELPPLDLCVVCVKQFDLTSAITNLKPVLGEKTLILPLLNGVDVHDRIRAVTSLGVVLPACVYVGTHIAAPGKVVQKGGACRIFFGPDPLHPGEAPGDLREIFELAGIKAEWTAGVQEEIWRKFIFICAFGLVSAAHAKCLGEILADAALSEQTQAIMREVVQVAEASGVPLPEDIVQVAFLKARTFPFEAKTSFQRDFERMDKPDERDLFSGTLLRMGERLGIDVPTARALASLLAQRKPL